MDYSGQTREITRRQFSNFMQLATENKDNNMTHLRDKLEQYISTEKLKGTADVMKDYTNSFINQHIKA